MGIKKEEEGGCVYTPTHIYVQTTCKSEFCMLFKISTYKTNIFKNVFKCKLNLMVK